MKTFNFLLCVNFLFWIGTTTATAQTTMAHIRNLFQAKCISCHAGTDAAAGLDLSGTESQIYAELVNVTATLSPDGEKLVKPGYPYRSFLLKKINNGLIHNSDRATLSEDEGEVMPPDNYPTTQPLANNEVELLRQWILKGAKLSGTTVNKTLIDSYYTEGGFEFHERPTPPANGFQIHLGPMFLAPDEEQEYAIKYALNLPQNQEITKLQVDMPAQSHHFILYKFLQGASNSINEGLRDIGIFNNPLGSNDNELVAVWQYSDSYRLPAGTAFFWKNNDVLDLNAHMRNYSNTTIMPFDVYINVITQDEGIAAKEMKSQLNLFNSPFLFNIPANAANYTLEEAVINSDAQYNIWQIGAHTHRLGVDYDVWKRNSNGTKGEQLYEGQINGYYDWAHPHIGTFEPFYTLPQGQGFIHRGTFTNPNNQSVSFGLETQNEMMITIFQYTEGQPIPFVGVPHIANAYCVNADPLVFQPEGGTITGNGTSGNTFDPALAGVGTHQVSYSYIIPSGETITANYDIEVTPSVTAPTIAEADNVLSTQGEYESYQWYMNGNAIPNANLNYYVPTQTGVYVLAVTQNGCMVFSDEQNVVIDGIALTNNAANITYIYPNPYQNQFQIQYELKTSATVSIDLYNLIGQKITTLVAESLQNSGAHNYVIDATQLRLGKGVYFVKTNINGLSYTQKIVQE